MILIAAASLVEQSLIFMNCLWVVLPPRDDLSENQVVNYFAYLSHLIHSN